MNNKLPIKSNSIKNFKNILDLPINSENKLKKKYVKNII